MLLFEIDRIENGRVITMDADIPPGAHWITLGKKDGEGPARRVLLDKSGKIIGGDLPKEVQGEKLPEAAKELKEKSKKEESKEPAQKSKTRGHLKTRKSPLLLMREEQGLSKVQSVSPIIAKELGVSKEEAEVFEKAIRDYSRYFADFLSKPGSTLSNYLSIRKGKDTRESRVIDEYIEKAPKWNGNGAVYRGVIFDKEIADGFAVGDMIDMDGVSSWSSNKEVADGFAEVNLPGKARVVVMMDKADHATSIMHISTIPGEEEILMSSKPKFEIMNIKLQDGGVRLITVKEVV